ncbi:Hypothetical protein PBC10988_18050 [Planctomycetales bacterium 10988]|nr:Hypothetical protein PBC10988_18050 [Planctomycetales bacterium 10988]
MIRRDLSVAPNRPGWFLICQSDHAELSGKLATAWKPASPGRWEEFPHILQAITHHDDGWHEWDRVPGICVESGAPYDFTEVPLTSMLIIWRHSIEISATFHPIAGYVVSAHFCWLLANSERFVKTPWLATLVENLWSPSTQRLLLQQRKAVNSVKISLQAQREWLLEFAGALPSNLTNGTAHDMAVASQMVGFLKEQLWRQIAFAQESVQKGAGDRLWIGLQQLRFYDWLSLWLCMRERDEPETFEPPAGKEVTFTPISTKDPWKAAFHVDPWPFQVESLDFVLPGKWAPMQKYRSIAGLASQWESSHQIEGKLVPK